MKTNNIGELFIDDVSISDDSLIAETFNDCFVNIGSKLAAEVSGNLSDQTDIESNTSCSSVLLKFSEISEEKVITEFPRSQSALT